jgi:hypothetical protein
MSTTAFIEAGKLNLTTTELHIIDEYSGGESLWINNFLRERRLDELTNSQKNKMENYARHLNNIIKNKSPPSSKKVIVYRGAEAMHADWKNLELGAELLFTNKGLISTTFNKNIALDFIENEDNCCLLILHLPRGTRGLYISEISVFNDFGEDEVILPHGSRFIVTAISNTKYKNKDILTYEAVLESQ